MVLVQMGQKSLEKFLAKRMSHLQQTENGVRKGLAVTHVQLNKGIELALVSNGTLQHSYEQF